MTQKKLKRPKRLIVQYRNAYLLRHLKIRVKIEGNRLFRGSVRGFILGGFNLRLTLKLVIRN